MKKDSVPLLDRGACLREEKRKIVFRVQREKRKESENQKPQPTHVPPLLLLLLTMCVIPVNEGRGEGAAMSLIERAPDPNQGMYRELTPEEKRLRRHCFLKLPASVRAEQVGCRGLADLEACKNATACEWQHGRRECWSRGQSLCLRTIRSLCETEIVQTFPPGSDPHHRYHCDPAARGRILSTEPTLSVPKD